MNLKQLAKRVSVELAPDEGGERYLLLEREWEPTPTRGLRRTTLEELVKLKGTVDRAVPGEFDYWMAFDEGAIQFSLLLLDGGQAGAGLPFPGKIGETALEFGKNLRKADWDALRLKLLDGANVLEQAADLAEDSDPEWIPSSKIRSTYRKPIREYLRWLKSVGQRSGLLAGNVEDRELQNCPFETKEERDRWLSLQLGQGHLILAIVENGELLSEEETDRLRREEIAKLPPIAKAKAEGRFEQALRELEKKGGQQ